VCFFGGEAAEKTHILFCARYFVAQGKYSHLTMQRKKSWGKSVFSLYLRK